MSIADTDSNSQATYPYGKKSEMGVAICRCRPGSGYKFVVMAA
jgi:hypothetical protein